MDKLFAPLKDLIGSVYDFLYDAATKVWSLAKPIVFIGLLFDLITGKFGWIQSILGIYRQFLSYTSGTHWLVLVLLTVVVVSFFSSKR